MHKLKTKLSLMVASLCVGVTVLAAEEGVSVPAVDSATAKTDGLEQSYEQMALLNQKIEFAKRKLVARGLEKDLEKMQTAQEQRDLGFYVASIEGFDQRLFALIMGENGGLTHVSPGAQVGSGFRISRITSSEVQVIDIQNQKTYIVPFLKQPALSDESSLPMTTSSESLKKENEPNKSSPVSQTDVSKTKV